MNEKEKAYCKHDLNVLFGDAIDTESHYPKTQVSSAFGMMCDELVEPTQLKSEIKYTFNATRSELEEIEELMKLKRELYNLEFPVECYSPDGRIMYTQSLFSTLQKIGFGKIAIICGSSKCIALNGFDATCDTGILQIGDIYSYDTDAFYFEGFPIIFILQESWGYWDTTNEEKRDRALKLADKEYCNLIEVEKKLAKHMKDLGIYAIIEL